MPKSAATYHADVEAAKRKSTSKPIEGRLVANPRPRLKPNRPANLTCPARCQPMGTRQRLPVGLPKPIKIAAPANAALIPTVQRGGLRKRPTAKWSAKKVQLAPSSVDTPKLALAPSQLSFDKPPAPGGFANVNAALRPQAVRSPLTPTIAARRNPSAVLAIGVPIRPMPSY